MFQPEIFTAAHNKVPSKKKVPGCQATTYSAGPAVIGKDSLPLMIDNIVSVRCQFTSAPFHARFILSQKVPGKKVPFTCTLLQALFIFF